MNKTQAMRASRLYVSVYRWGRNWTMSCPWDMSRPMGHYTVHQYATYAQARRVSACARAEVVLSMMGRLSEEARAEIHWHSSDPYKDHSFRALVKAGLSV